MISNLKTEIKKYFIKGPVWRDEGPGAWFFVTVPKDVSQEIRNIHQESEEGWGRLKSKVQINNTAWSTAIWFDTKSDTYLVPIKSLIRKKEKIVGGTIVSITLEIEY